MRAHRLSLAIVATTATLCGVISPVAMAETPGSSSQDPATAATQNTDAKPAGSSKTDAQDKKGSSDKPADKPAGTQKEKTPEQIECDKATEEAIRKHKEAIENGTVGSSFLGPMELAKSVFKGYGSSGMPELPDCAKPKEVSEDETTPSKEDMELPEWLESSRLTPEAREGFGWAKLAISILGILFQGILFASRVNPQILDPVRALVHRAGIKI